MKGIQSKIYQLKPEIEREAEYLKELRKRPGDANGLRVDTLLSLDLKDDQKEQLPTLLTPVKAGSNDENMRSPLLDGLSGRKPTALFRTKRVNKESRDSCDLDHQYQ